MTVSTDFLVSKSDLGQTRLTETDLGDLADGQVLLRIEKFALTANNITYAVVGDQMAYWNFFPAEDGWGRVPVWGFATVAESRHPEIAVGERVYGYLPMSSHLVVEPGKIADGTFLCMAAHRQPMNRVYNNYRRLAADPAHNPDLEEYRALFEPLFMTSFLIEAFMRRQDYFGAKSLLMTSASSKTGMALAQVAKARSPQIERVGLTSAGNVEFVEGLGLYDRVIAYDAIGYLDAAIPSVVVDFAGNGKTLSAIHNHFADNLKYSCLVGATHWEARGLAPDIAGPTPILFFAPDHVVAMTDEFGPEGFGMEVGKAWGSFIGEAKGWVDVLRREGGEAASETYAILLGGKASPRDGFILSL
jgi:NADPH:quinone reductase-like Zn-dependent oxidoreductase